MKDNMKIDAKNVEDILPLTSMQKSMLFMLIFKPSEEFYFEQQRYRISGSVSVDLIRRAWNAVAENNEMLRTVYRWEGLKNPLQITLKEKEIPFKYFDITSEEDSKVIADEIEFKEWEDKPDIRFQPFRVALCKVSQDEYHMILSSHHIILDGWSNAVMLKEFYEAYCCLYYGKEIVKKSKVKYKEYIQWILKQDKKEALEIWGAYLKDYIPDDTYVFYEELYKSSNAGIYSYRFDKNLINRLKLFTQKHGITLAALFYSVWGIMQIHALGKKDILFAITVSGRSMEVKGIDELIGMLIKTFPMRINITGNEGILDLVRQLCLDLIDIENSMSVELHDILQYEEIPNINNMRTAVVVQNYPLDNFFSSKASPLFAFDLYSSRYVTNFDIVLGIKIFPHYTELEFNYNCDMYTNKSICDMCENFILTMEAILEVFNKEDKNAAVYNISSDRRQKKGEVYFNEIF